MRAQPIIRESRPSAARPIHRVLAAVLLTIAASSASLAQIPADLIEQALDQPVAEIRIEAPLDEALATLGEKTGLAFDLDKAAAALMPYGAKTRIKLEMRDLAVREGLTRVLQGLGLRMELRGDRLAVTAAPVLDRVGRRMLASEAGLLAKLAGAPWSEAAGDVPLHFSIDPTARPREKFDETIAEQVRSNRRATALIQLDGATQRLGWSWRPDADQIVIETRRDDVARRLDRPIELSYQRARLDDVLADLGRRVGVTMLFEPGSLQRIDARERAVDLVQRGVTVRQTLERICGNTGLRYEIIDEGVRVLAPLAGPAPAAIGGEIVRMTVEVRPGIFMEVVMPVRELPPDLQKDFEKRVKDLFGKAARSGE